jgi:hypothetical protein
MDSCVHLWQCLAEFFLEREIFQTKFVGKVVTHILRSIISPRPLTPEYRFRDNVKKNCGSNQTTDDSGTKATDTHTHIQNK